MTERFGIGRGEPGKRGPAEGGIPVISEGMLADRKYDFEHGISYAPRVTLFLIAVNVAVFVWELATGALAGTEALAGAGALLRERVMNGEAWRLASAVFLHGSIQHLIGNCLILYILGMACEHMFGFSRTALVYVSGGLCGSLLSISLQPGPSVGASGAVFGVMAAVILFFYRHRLHFHLRDKRIGIVLAGWAFYQFVMGSLSPYVDNAAHIGGFVGGGAVSSFLEPLLLSRTEGKNPHT